MGLDSIYFGFDKTPLKHFRNLNNLISNP
jgi:hypothetical protein